ncbi:MAG: hypothetical protein QW228_08025 [Candidatus Aenigmatarchaeota archaeon]
MKPFKKFLLGSFLIFLAFYFFIWTVGIMLTYNLNRFPDTPALSGIDWEKIALELVLDHLKKGYGIFPPIPEWMALPFFYFLADFGYLISIFSFIAGVGLIISGIVDIIEHFRQRRRKNGRLKRD